MKAHITLSTKRGTPYAMEYIDAKDRKKVPKDFELARKKWESGDQAGAKALLLPFLRCGLGEPLGWPCELHDTSPRGPSPNFVIGEVWWTANPIPDIAVEMKFTLDLKEGVSVKTVEKAILDPVNSGDGVPELFCQIITIEWSYDGPFWWIACVEPWEFRIE